jgi:protein-disulfide isomerase
MKKFLTTTLMSVTLAGSAWAFDINSMSDAERETFRQEIRAYLLENPEVIFEAVDVMKEKQAAAEAQGDQNLVEANFAELVDDGFSWVGGNPDGDITVVEFMDYRCGYCRKAYQDVETLIDMDDNIRFVVKEFPILGDDSMASSQFAIAVKHLYGDDAYKAAHDALIMMRGPANGETLGALATELGHDGAAIAQKMISDEVTKEIEATRALAQRMNINGTPSFLIGSEMVRGYVPLENMQAIVADERG